MRRAILILMLVLVAVPTAALAKDYVIGAGDSLAISVWGENDLNAQVMVRPDGKITMPAIGDVVAEGLTAQELQSRLAEKLRTLVKEPIVTVMLMNTTNSKAYIVGGGVKAGVFDLKQRTTLLQLLAAVGELGAADLKNAYVLRGGEKIKANFQDLYSKGDMSQDIELEGNDTIFFPLLKERMVYMLGAFTAPKAVPYREGLTVLDAILEVGGYNRFASENSTKIIRTEADGKKTFISVKGKKLVRDGDLTQNVELQGGDSVICEESFF